MKRIILAALVGMLVSGLAWGETVKLGDLRERGGVHYKKFTDIPFSGTVTGLSHGKLKNGKKEGPWVRYWENGQLSSKGTWKDGKREGPWVRYKENGQLYSEGTFKDGRAEGPWVEYNVDGTLNKEWSGTFKVIKKGK